MTDVSQPSLEDPRERFRWLIHSSDQQSSSVYSPVPPTKIKKPRGWAVLQDWIKGTKPIFLSLSRRALLGIAAVTVIIFLTYVGLEMAISQDVRSAFQHAIQSTPSYMLQLLNGDLGQTNEYGFSRRPVDVGDILPGIVLRSLGLLTASMLVAIAIGIPIGIWAALRKHRGWSVATLSISLVGISLPSFFLALVLQLGVIQLTALSGRTVLPVGGFGWDAHILLPALVLAARPLAQTTRITHTTFRDVLTTDYIRTAHSKGLTPSWVMRKHILRNTAIPILTTIGLGLRFALISLPVVEYFFGWQGLGYYLLKAISVQEYEFAIAMLLVLAALFIVVNIVLEFSYLIIDPRLRAASRTPDQMQRTSLWELIRSIPDWLIGIIPISRRERISSLEINQTHPISSESSIGVTTSVPDNPEEVLQELSRRRRLAWINPSLVIGMVLVLILGVITVFGSKISPHSPYTTRGLAIEAGEFTMPPFEPNEVFPFGTDMLGRDLLSLILAGAQQTFILVGIVVVARLAVGFLLGAAAGWWQGSWLDRALMSLVEIIAAFPALLLAMVLILALNIRNGLLPFIFALCFVGWGEIMQFVRGEVIRLRPASFIESAVSTGANTTRLIFGHVNPNLIPALISVAVLEMGAVLMLLGELGFIGIFIGGGIFAELEWMAPLFHYSDVPEWGALLSNIRFYARGYPWMAIYPGLAFFLAILAFNLLGEGLNQSIDVVGVRITRFLNRYTLALGAVAVLGLMLLRGSTGAISVYSRYARLFDGVRALQDVEALSMPQVEGRALGSLGMDTAAHWVAERFEALGLQPAGDEFDYFQIRKREYEQVTSIPILALDDHGAALHFQKDYNTYPSLNTISGTIQAPVRVLVLGKVSSYEQHGYRYYELDELDYPEEILLVLEDEISYVERIPKRGALVITADTANLRRRFTYSPYDMFGREGPMLWVSEATANRLLENIGMGVEELRRRAGELNEEDYFEAPTGVTAAVSVEGEAHMREPVTNVIGHWQGVVSNEFEGIDNQLIVVLAKYDCPPIGPDGREFVCADDNASGLAVMLETIRVMRDSGYQPYRTFLFIAYAGEGLEGGGTYSAEDVMQFLEAKHGFSRFYDIEAVIELRGLIGGESEQMVIETKGSLRLAKLLESSAERMNLPVEITGTAMDLNRIFSSGSEQESGEQAPRVALHGYGWEEKSHTAEDTCSGISEAELEKAGETLSLSLMILGRELDY